MAPLDSPIPVTIIAGSFGVGKTTACNQLLELLASKERSVAVITHRFAEEYACQPLLINSFCCSLLEEVYDYGSGCLCCTPGGELNQRLNSMISWGERYDHVLIRTGPAADPLIFADAVQRSSAYKIAGIVTVIDATGPCFEDQLLSGASLDQLSAADVLLVRSKDQDASQCLAALKLKDAPIHMWKNPLSEADIGLLTCRSPHREYVCKPSSLVPNLMASHETTLRAVQIVENGAVSNVDVCKAWMMNLMNQGFCIRLKAVLPVATPSGSQSLLVNAVRGKPAEFQLVAEAPPQIYMGDLPVLVGMRDIDADEPMCRIFILLGPPSVKGLGDMPESLLLKCDAPLRRDLLASASSKLLYREIWNVQGILARMHSSLTHIFAPKECIALFLALRLNVLCQTRDTRVLGKTIEGAPKKSRLTSSDMLRDRLNKEFEQIYNLALTLTVENDHATVVRAGTPEVKNGFHSPSAGGYCDLKLFLLIAHDKPEDGGTDGSKVCHICELQVHLKQFLACKKFTHLPYVIDRGDFDQT
ncbi:Cbwd1 [Symbiodinium sp. CCMP2456]|nr:Cbwd1 [Symbiodinium sp. CCMP2456]